MPRAERPSGSPQERARAALGAVLASLPDVTPGSEAARALAAAGPRLRDALVRLVARAAFQSCASARGLVTRGTGGTGVEASPVPEAWPFGQAAHARALDVACDALAAAASEGELAALEPHELGGFYEGLLGIGVELARTTSVVVELPRPAGGAAVDRLVPLAEQGGAGRGGARARAAPIGAGRFAALRSVERRRSGSHYTPPALAERVVRDALGPLLGAAPSPDAVLAVRVCDPALGTAAFLVAACHYLAERLLEAEQRGRAGNSMQRAAAADSTLLPAARRRVALACLFGVDRDALAVEVAREALWLAIGDAELPLRALEQNLRPGEALLGPPAAADGDARGTERGDGRGKTTGGGASGLDWERSFPEVFRERGGFDAFVGNPPWVSYAGRAAQPLAEPLRRAYERYESFHGYRNLQGLFVERAARLLRPGGRLGFVLPSSMSELRGYAPTRRAHDRWCAPDPALADLGADAFDGVFQPCMVLASTRRAAPLADVADAPWPVERPDLDRVALRLLAKLARTPLPPHLFGERGLQSTGRDRAHLALAPDARHSVPLRSGGDVEAFGLRAPSAHADPEWFGRRLRAATEWEAVRVLVRQTARVPVAALSDGIGFRNSLLAGFEDTEHSAAFLVAYLNSTPIRWLHYARHRDARQGMPQLKVQHLRATPSPPSRALVRDLAAFGAELSARGRGIKSVEQVELDELVSRAFELDAEERARLAEFRAAISDGRPRV